MSADTIMHFGAEQADRRMWRAWVFHDGKRHWLGYRDQQADALKAARAVWCSLRGDWSGGNDKPLTLRERFGRHLAESAFQIDANGEPIIVGTRGDIRERPDWYLCRVPADVAAAAEKRWPGSTTGLVGDHGAVLTGAGSDFVLAIAGAIGVPFQPGRTPPSLHVTAPGFPIRDVSEKQSPKTEGLPKSAPGGLAAQGLSAHKTATPYLSMAEARVRAKATRSKGMCEHCGAPMFRPRGRFCSNRCRMAAARLAVSP